MLKTLIRATLLLSLSSQCFAGDVPDSILRALKTKTPNQLPYYSVVSKNCGIPEKEINSIIEGVLTRSRIKPVSGYEWVNSPLYLSASIVCLKDVPTYVTSVYFAKATPIPILYDYSFGFFGTFSNGTQYLKDSFKRSIENAITAYIQANFDL